MRCLAIPLFAVFVLAPAVAVADAPLQAEVAVGAASTLVYRGLPQYSSTDIPSLQLAADVSYDSSAGLFFFDALAATTFWERRANSELGNADYIDLAAGYQWELDPSFTLDLGGAIDLRPQAEEVDARKEVLVRARWLAIEREDWSLAPTLELRGEVHRHLGVFAVATVRAEREMGNGFVFAGEAGGGWSYYAESDARYQYGAVKGEIVFRTPVPRLSVAAFVSGALLRDVISTDVEFAGRHGLVWSAFFVRYDIQ
jgi:hypothetical protein